MKMLKNLRSSTLLLPLAALLGSCGGKLSPENFQSVGPNHIIGGVALEEEGLRDEVVALTTKTGHIFCTATLIAPKLLITAGHCVEDLSVVDFRVYQGLGKVGEEVVPQVEIQRYEIHPDYDKNTRGDSDVAWVELKEELPHKVSPAKILNQYESLQDLRDGLIKNITLVGFGRTDPDLSVNSFGKKMEVQVPLLATFTKEILVGQKEPLKGACKGDSGGPAFIQIGKQNYLIGVTSRAAGTDLCYGGKAYYGLTSGHLCWLEKSSGVSLGADVLGCAQSTQKKGEKSFMKACRAKSDSYASQTAKAMLRAVKAQGCAEAYELLQKEQDLDLKNRDLRDLTLLSDFPKLKSIHIEGNPLVEVDSLKQHPGIESIYVDGMDLPTGGILLLGLGSKKDIHFKKSIMMDMYLKGQKYYVEYFLKRGMDINYRDEKGKTLLILAVSRADQEGMKHFVEMGAKVDLLDADGDTLLAYSRTKEDFLYLLEKFEDPKKAVAIKNNLGISALIRAITFGDLDLVKYLVEDLEADISYNLKIPRLSPSFVALLSGHYEIWTYLQTRLEASLNALESTPELPVEEDGGSEALKGYLSAKN